MAKTKQKPGENVTKNKEGVCVTRSPPEATVHGYARCSTDASKQDIDRQVRSLRAAGATRIWMEYEHGDSATKQAQADMMATCRPGDTIIVTEVSRLARSVRQLLDVIDAVRDGSLCLSILGSVTVDCRNGQPDPMTMAVLQVAGIFAELELSMTRARVRDGMANARAKGVRIGRPRLVRDDIPDTFWRYLNLYRQHQINATELARLAGISRPTVYRYLSIIS